MTQAIISAVVKKLADLLVDEVRSLGGVDRKLDEVKLQLGQMQSFLKDANSKNKRDDENIKGWVCDVMSVAYETEDAIDAFLVEANYRWFGVKPYRLLARFTLGEKISRIQAKLGRISEGRTTFGIQNLSQDRGHSESLRQAQPSFKRRVLPDVDNSEIVGFEAEKRDIINLLLHGPSDQSRRVVSIVGPGGLGKTTLAQKVYTSSSVRNHFNSWLWITVSQELNFNLLDELKNIHQKLTNETEWKRVLGVLKEKHQEGQIVFLLEEVNTLLKEKKYLIVLDDVWTELVFTQLKTGLVDVRNGSRVLMTTRNLDVANCTDSSGVYRLRFLNEEESFGLFLKNALPSSNHSLKCPDELSDLATKLVKRCEGLPLALIVLGGLVSSKPRTHHEWSKVLEKLDWHNIGEGECMKVLATSYDDLPYNLKSCFRYLACFPEDYEIGAKDLMLMWIAEGLIEVEREGELEDYAEDYLEELVQRCLVQVVERSPDGAIMVIRIHDLLREVALEEARNNDFLLIWKKVNAEKHVHMARRVAFHKKTGVSSSNDGPKKLRKMPIMGNSLHFNYNYYYYIETDASSSNYSRNYLEIDDGGPMYLTNIKITNIKMPKLRTFLNFNYGSTVIPIESMLLRVLELRDAIIRDLPTNLKNMIHLRYLGLRGTQLNVIPSWIGHLQNLQTFNIEHTKIRELPKSFWKITSLRHVHSSSPSYIVGPPSTTNLVNLRCLRGFLVPKSWKDSFPDLLGVRELELYCDDEHDGMLIHALQSKLKNILTVSFSNFYPERGMIDFSTSLSYKNIHTMFLSGYNPLNPPTVYIVEMPLNLAKLTLCNFRLHDDSMLKLEKLRSLKCLNLADIIMKADTIVCTHGGFPGLQSLQLVCVNEMKEWRLEYGALPMLKYLLIKSCKNLRALPDLQCVTTLQQLEIDSELHSIIENKSGVEWDKVKHIPTIVELPTRS